MSPEKRHGSQAAIWVALMLLVVLALILRLRLLDRPMRYDEAFTVWRYAENGWRVAISDYSLPNNHVMHTLAVALWGKLFGFAPAVVRTPALVAGVALVPMGFLAARRLAGRGAGLLAAAVLAASAAMIDASVEARGYTMAALATVTAVWLGTHILVDPHRRLPWVGLVAVAAFGLWTVPVFAYPLAGIAVWLALPRAGRHRSEMAARTAVALIGIGFLTALLYRPILAADPKALFANSFVTPDPFSHFLAAVPDLVGRVTVGWTWLVWTPVAVVLAIGAGAAFAPDARRPEMLRLAGAAVTGPAVVLLIHHAVPYPRNFLPLYPLAVVLACGGLARIGSAVERARHGWVTATAALAVILVVQSVNLSGADQPPSRRGEFMGAAEAARILAARVGPNDRITAPIPASAPLRYYLLLEGFDPPPDGDQDIYFVIPDERTLQDGIQEAGVPLLTEPQLVSRVDDGTIYVARIPNSGKPSQSPSDRPPPY